MDFNNFRNLLNLDKETLELIKLELNIVSDSDGISEIQIIQAFDLFGKTENYYSQKLNKENIVKIFNELIHGRGVSYSSDDNRVQFEQNDVFSYLEKVPKNSIDLIVTDPAYSGMNQMLKLGRGKIIGEYSQRGDGEKWFDEFHDTEENYTRFLQECFRVMKPNSHIYIMFDSYSLLTLAPLCRKIFDVKNILVWDKINIGLGHYFRRRHEFILFATKGKKKLKYRNIPDVWRIKRISNFKYPTQKPTEVFEMMISSSAYKDDVVLDPFMGSGSSAIAALKSECIYLGCDKALSAINLSGERVATFLKDKKDILQPKSHYVDENPFKL